MYNVPKHDVHWEIQLDWSRYVRRGEERREATVVSVRPGLTQIRTWRAGCCPIACGVRHV